MVSRAHRRCHEQDGQVALFLLFCMLAILGGGMLLLQVGHASVLQTDAQTAADAAALAGARNVRDQLYLTDRRDPTLIDDRRVRAAAADYAARNDATVVEYQREGLDVIVAVATDEALDDVAPGGAGGQRGRASARARVVGGTAPTWSGEHVTQTVPAAPPGPGGVVEAAWREADRLDKLRFPYLLGGGHVTPAAVDGPFYDCSSAVSRVLQAAGYNIPTLVSGQFKDHFPRGPGRITIYAYDGHVFMVIDGRGWGTSTLNPGGGPGWLPYNTPYHARFEQFHAPVENDVVPEDLGDHAIPVMTGGTPYEMILVPLDGS